MVNLMFSSLRQVSRRFREYDGFSDRQLQAEVHRIRAALQRRTPLAHCMPVAIAVSMAACARTLGIRHYPVQIRGAMEMARGRIIEMQTGEGKTITALLTASLYAMYGKGCHVVTSKEKTTGTLNSAWTPCAPPDEFLTLRCGLTARPPAPGFMPGGSRVFCTTAPRTSLIAHTRESPKSTRGRRMGGRSQWPPAPAEEAW
ncbi:MAG: hypothetical protein KDA96_12045 [Planctomycetaceae bacterium]|nr:hypothetical protein [Planctomycetaceae bacterium]